MATVQAMMRTLEQTMQDIQTYDQLDTFFTRGGFQLADIKSIILNGLTDAQLRKQHFQGISLQITIPQDVQQLMVSFCGQHSVRPVSKAFNQLSKKNESNIFRRQYNALPTPLKDLVIIHPKRKFLHPEEISRGFKAVRCSSATRWCKGSLQAWKGVKIPLRIGSCTADP